MAHPVTDQFRHAADLNEQDPTRHGSTIHLPPGLELFVAGDMHGHRRNLMKLIEAVDLGRHPQRRLVLQELIHGEEDPRTGYDRSIETTMRAIRLHLQYPGQVLFVMANHDIAQITGNEITKQGRGSVQSFNEGVRQTFPDDAEDVLSALGEFLLSQPLAIRCPGGVMITHSLPHPDRMPYASLEIFQREYRQEDFHRGHPVYEWVWGRNHTAEQVEKLAEELDVSFFVVGHQHVEEGWCLLPARGMVMTSDHERGCVLRFAGDQPLTPETIDQHVTPIQLLDGPVS